MRGLLWEPVAVEITRLRQVCPWHVQRSLADSLRTAGDALAASPQDYGHGLFPPGQRPADSLHAVTWADVATVLKFV